ncbi:MAG: LLM class flavin-dependent oxidoreductase [Gammaproteobacteria bacterium]|jgi:alkanesulfonate monooxygenase SsuD/methylene tetrahydromethanopterin reductase-like flavin-dependent oxidoreductase (luciferase family)|nr:LLM class flavin-dependent oxidoreductase [Gammaproteobacteria bacterium]MDP6695253.1 LLM class flavin-dependent oxidoreductase [Gammaproteobacteria bacterium]
MRVDLIIQPHLPAAEFAALGELAEQYGISGVWVSNHLDGRDPFVNFVPLAERTQQLHMGPTALSPYEEHPMQMAKLLLTLNEIAGGRAHVAVGGGGGTVDSMGIKPARMVRAVRECLEILRLATSKERVTYEGEIFQMHGLDTGWAKAPPPAIFGAANGEQMLRMSARYADGIMTSDFTPVRLRWAREIIDPVLKETGRDPASFPLINFWACHIKATREEAMAEARLYLMARATIWAPYINDVVSAEEAAVVAKHYPAFVRAYRRSSDIEGPPRELVDKIVGHGVTACAASEIDGQIDRFREMHAAGATGVALCLYNDPADAIRVIGEHVVPALKDI